MFLSTYVRLSQFATQLWVILKHSNISCFKFVARHIALLMGKVILLHIFSYLLERVVSKIFLLNTMLANYACHIVAHFDKRLQLVHLGYYDGGEEGRATLMMMTLVIAAAIMRLRVYFNVYSTPLTSLNII